MRRTFVETPLFRATAISEAGRNVLARLVQQIKAEPLGSEPPDVP